MANYAQSLMSKLCQKLQRATSLEEKISILDEDPRVRSSSFPLPGLSLKAQCVLKQLVAVGQIDRLRGNISLPDLLESLVSVDAFYRELGGIVGYHEAVHSLLQDTAPSKSSYLYHSPPFIDISEPSEAVQEMIGWGLEAMPALAEIYPLGGAADRLHLVDETTGVELPAAKLAFAGNTLFERLMRDLMARENLYFQRTRKRVITPIAIMTSLEKKNHDHVLQMLEENQWFHRPKESFRLFTQPLVPVLNEQGRWCFSSPSQILLKPGGHGVMWKLARDSGVFAWLKSLDRTKALVRQINNPLAGLDYTLLAFTGIGWKKNMKFGFASCPRLLQAAEGVNVLVERQEQGKNTLVLTNIEYCDFAKFGIEDRPLKEGEPFSRFSSNTNILFADLRAVEEAVDRSPFPGMLFNLKQGISMDEKGNPKEEKMGRLESTMQNIADVFVEKKQQTLATQHTFITYSHRHKTISTAKRAYREGMALQETPENCFYDVLYAARELLEKECGFLLPPQRTVAEYMQQGPDCVFLYHPILGPLYSLIRQKVQGGRLALGSLLQLEISALCLSGLDLDGSFRVWADPVETGRCVLRNIVVRNRGVAWDPSRPFWKGKYALEESVEILLKGHSEFVAENVIFRGSHSFAVEEGTRLIVYQKEGELLLTKEPLKE